MTRSRLAISGLLVLSLSAIAGAQVTGVNDVKIHPYEFADFPASGFNSTDNFPMVTLNDPNVNASGQGNGSGAFANRHLWFTSNDHGATDYGLSGASDFFDFTFSMNLTASGGSRKEAGMFLRTGGSTMIDGQFLVSSDFGGNGGEVAVFGGAFPFYSFTSSNGAHYTDGTTVTLGLRYFQDTTDTGHTYHVIYSYNGIQSPSLELGNNFDIAGLTAGTKIGAYFQIPKNGNDINAPNSATVVFNDIAVHAVPEPATYAVLGMGALALVRGRRRA